MTTSQAPRPYRLLPALALLGACAHATFVPTGATYPARQPDCHIEVFSAALPDRPFEELGVLEGDSGWEKASLEEVLPKLREEACAVGGDALVLHMSELYETSSGGLEMTRLRAVATVVRWTDVEGR